MKRYFLQLAYNGKNYSGWQHQENAHSLQAELEKALLQLFGIPVPTVASGRTDAGVHAREQYVQVDLDFPLTPQHLYSLNRILPFDMALQKFYPVVPQAHVRFDAHSRTYEYRITTCKNPFLAALAYYFSKPLEIAIMNEACQLLMHQNDFQSFSKVHTDVQHYRCHLYQATWQQTGDKLIFTVEANRFLRGMVRALVGTLLEIGLKRITLSQLEQIILAKDRKAAGRSVPAHGLYLTKIKYPESLFL